MIVAIVAALITIAPNARAATFRFDSIHSPSGLVNYCFDNPNGWNLVPENTVFYIILGYVHPMFPSSVMDDLNNAIFDPEGDLVIGSIDWSAIDDITGKPLYLSNQEVTFEDSQWEGTGVWGTILVVSTFPETGTADWYSVWLELPNSPGGGWNGTFGYGDPSAGISGSGITVIPEPATGLLAPAGVALRIRRKRMLGRCPTLMRPALSGQTVDVFSRRV